MRLRKSIVKALLFFVFFSLTLSSFPISPFFVPLTKAQYEGITYDGVNNVVTFAQNSTDFLADLYIADTSNNLTLLASTNRFMCWSRENSPSTWLNESAAANEATAGDMNLPLKNAVSPQNDAYYFGSDRWYNTITLNVTTAGVGSWTTANMIFERSSGVSTFATQSVTDNTNRFKNSGVNTITFTPSILWVKGTVNSVSAYWIRVRYTATTATVTTAPKGGQAWLNYDLDVDVRPAESLQMQLDVIVTSYTTAGSIKLSGTNKSDIAISESIAVSSAATYTTTNFYKTVDSYGINATGEFTFFIQQRRWAVVVWAQAYNGLADYSWVLLSAIQFGDGSNYYEISTQDWQVFIPSGLTWSGQTYLWTVKAYAVLTLGVLNDASVKSVKQGMQIQLGTGDFLDGEADSIVNLYGISLKGFYTYPVLHLYGSQNRIWANLYDVKLSGINLDMYNVLAYYDGSSSFLENTAEDISGTFDRITITNPLNVLGISQYVSSDITIQNLYARNYTYLVYLLGSGSNQPNMTFINPDVDSWTFVFPESWTGKVWRKYTFDLTTDANSRIELTYYGVGGGIIYNATDIDGIIPTQILSKGFYNRTGGGNIYAYEPYHLKISKSGFTTYEANFTFNNRKNWEINLVPLAKYVPVARFNNTITTVNPNQAVTLDGSMSYDPDGGSLTNYSWNFGDGNTTSGYYPTVTHKWSSANNYKINLTVTDDESATNFFVWMINVTDYVNPVARFRFSPSNPQPTQTVSFNGSSSHDPDGTIINYYWTFGDGYSYNSSSPTTNHAFSTASSYTTTLEVTDNQGAKNTFSQNIVVASTETATTSGPSPETYPDFDISFNPLPDYFVYIPFLSDSFQTSLYLHNKGKFGKETQVLFWIENENNEKVYEKSESLFVNALETRDLDVTLTSPAETGTYTLYAKIISQTRTTTVARQSLQNYDLINWLIGPGIIVTVLIVICMVAIVVILLKKFRYY